MLLVCLCLYFLKIILKTEKKKSKRNNKKLRDGEKDFYHDGKKEQSANVKKTER